MMHSKNGQKVSSFLGDKCTIYQGSLWLKERSHKIGPESFHLERNKKTTACLKRSTLGISSARAARDNVNSC